MSFDVGERVKCIKAYDDNQDAVGKTGTIIEAGYNLAVEFDKPIEDGHDAGGGKLGHVWEFPTDTDCLVLEFTSWKDRYKK